MKHNMKNRFAGFTLIELIMSIVVLAIVVGIGVPSFMTLIHNNRISTQANRFVTDLNIARSEAIRRGSSIDVAAISNNWANGWTVQLGATVIRTNTALKNNSTLADAGGATSLTFDSRGFLSGSALTFNLANAKSTCDRQITVAPGGRVNTNTKFNCN
jgi:type IV fimbrial biogenesis protein FimT